MMTDPGGGWWIAMWASMVTFWMLIIATVWVIFATGRPGGSDRDPERILKRRLARGEISREDYLALVRELKRGGSPPGVAAP